MTDTVTLKKLIDDSGLKTKKHYKEILVPIKFGSLDKYFMRRTEDASGQRYYIQLPTMAVTFSSFTFDATRSTSSRQRRFLLPPEKYSINHPRRYACGEGTGFRQL